MLSSLPTTPAPEILLQILRQLSGSYSNVTTPAGSYKGLDRPPTPDLSQDEDFTCWQAQERGRDAEAHIHPEVLVDCLTEYPPPGARSTYGLPGPRQVPIRLEECPVTVPEPPATPARGAHPSPEAKPRLSHLTSANTSGNAALRHSQQPLQKGPSSAEPLRTGWSVSQPLALAFAWYTTNAASSPKFTEPGDFLALGI